MDVSNRFFAYWDAVEAHIDCIDLGMGMPSPDMFPSVNNLQTKLVEGLQHQADYQPQAGAIQIRKALAAYESNRTGLIYTADNIMLTAGALRGFSLVVEHLANSTSQFIEIAPTYPLLSGYINKLQKRLRQKHTTVMPQDRQRFRVKSDEVVPHIKKSSIVILTNPNNPTGLYTSHKVIADTISACEQSGSYLVVDETCDIPLKQNTPRFWIKSPALIRIQSFSKNLLLAGYRIGYIVADATLINQLAQHYSFSDGNAPIVVNEAILEYLQNSQKVINDITRVIRAKHQLTLEILSNVPEIEDIIEPEACYYMFIKVNTKMDSWQLFEYLLDARVNVLPGELFGMEGYGTWIRICYAKDNLHLVEGLTRLKVALAALPNKINNTAITLHPTN